MKKKFGSCRLIELLKSRKIFNVSSKVNINIYKALNMAYPKTENDMMNEDFLRTFDRKIDAVKRLCGEDNNSPPAIVSIQSLQNITVNIDYPDVSLKFDGGDDVLTRKIRLDFISQLIEINDETLIVATLGDLVGDSLNSLQHQDLLVLKVVKKTANLPLNMKSLDVIKITKMVIDGIQKIIRTKLKAYDINIDNTIEDKAQFIINITKTLKPKPDNSKRKNQSRSNKSKKQKVG